MGTLSEDCAGRPPGTYCGKLRYVEAVKWMRLEIWEGTPCRDCADRPLGTPRVVGVVCLVVDVYAVFLPSEHVVL